MLTCDTPSGLITAITRADGNDLTTSFTMRYRLASDPDVDASYTAVTTTKDMLGVTMPYFDISGVDPGTYVVHTYLTSSGSSTGTKVTIVVECGDVGPGV
jgi:hypothetical protein